MRAEKCISETALFNEASFDDALWFWHEVGSLIHYHDVPQLAEQVFVDTNWILALVNGLVEQAQDAPDGVVVDQGRQPSEKVGGRDDGLVGGTASVSVDAEWVGYG